jgi:hypothetical protein
VCAYVTLAGSIGGLSSSGDKHEAARAGAVADRRDAEAELARLQAAQKAMAGTYQPTGPEALKAATEAAQAAKRTRIAECSDGDPKKRRVNCKAREADEGAVNATLVTVANNKAATHRAALLDGDAAAIRARLPSMQLVQP